MNIEQFSLNEIKVNMPTQDEKNRDKHAGFILKRDLDYGECEYILEGLLGLWTYSRADCRTDDGFEHIKNNIVKATNKWLRGEWTFDDVQEASCPEDILRMPDMIMMLEVVKYLKDNDIIK